jgi:Flp pilus assembly protein TadG
MLRSIFYKASREERGSVVTIVAFGIVALVGLLALAIDLGQLYVVKNELQNVADAAALAGAKQLLQAKSGSNYVVSVYCSEAVTASQDCASRNKSSGQPMTISPEDVVIGQWDVNLSRFVKTGCSVNPMEANAVQVTVRRQGGTNPKIATFFAGIFGVAEQTSSATATALLGVAGTSALDIPFAVPSNYVAGQSPYARLKSYPLDWLTPAPAYAANPQQYTWKDLGGSTLDTTRASWVMPKASEKSDASKLQKYIKGPDPHLGGIQHPQVLVGDQLYPLSEYYYGSYNKTNFTYLKNRFNHADTPKVNGKWRITAAVYSTQTVTGLAPQNSLLQLAGRFLPGVSQAFACTPYPYPAVYIQGFITLDVIDVVVKTDCVTTDGSTQITNPNSCRNTCYLKVEVPLTLNSVATDKGGSPVPFQRDYKDMNAAAADVGVFAAVPRLVK